MNSTEGGRECLGHKVSKMKRESVYDPLFLIWQKINGGYDG